MAIMVFGEGGADTTNYFITLVILYTYTKDKPIVFIAMVYL
ncbi:hypothetical protein [Niallia sp. NCCP-28]|nr:hypothetical protein [Niallia sp. NCCP-28]